MRGVCGSFVLAAVVCIATACSSQMVTVVSRPPQDYEVLGRAYGAATGSMLVLGPLTNFIPVLLNDRTERAVQRAISGVPGATGRINVQMRADWYWFYLGTARVVTIIADAIKER